MKSTEGGAVLWMLFEGTGKQTTPSEGEPPKARALQWGDSPFSLTGHRLNSHGAEAQRLGAGRPPRAGEADSGCLLENGSPQRGLAFC